MELHGFRALAVTGLLLAAACGDSSTGDASTETSTSSTTSDAESTAPATSGPPLPEPGTSGTSDLPPEDRFRLLCARWTGSAEVVEEVNPAGGSRTELGQFNGLAVWSDEFVVNGDGTRAHALGRTAGAEDAYLYTLTLDTGESRSVPTEATNLAGTRRDGTVVGLRLAAETLDVSILLIDPTNGNTEFVGEPVPLGVWNNTSTFDRERDFVYIADARESAVIRRIDLAGQLTDVFDVPQEATQLRGVRSNGDLIAVQAATSGPLLLNIELSESAEIATSVTFDQIVDSDYGVVFDTVDDRAFLVGSTDASGPFRALFRAAPGGNAARVGELPPCALAKY